MYIWVVRTIIFAKKVGPDNECRYNEVLNNFYLIILNILRKLIGMTKWSFLLIIGCKSQRRISP